MQTAPGSGRHQRHRVDTIEGVLIAHVRLRRRRLACPECGFTTRARYDTRVVDSRWRGLDLGRHKVDVRASLRRLRCPTHGVRTEGVPFAGQGPDSPPTSRTWSPTCATKIDKSTITRLQRID